MFREVAFLTFSLFTFASGLALGQEPQMVVSRDGKLTALIISAGKDPGHGRPESRVEVRSSVRKVLAAHDYTSQDGEHGYRIAKVTWTPDSQYLVYSLENSGGHQPWHYPVQFYSRKQNVFLSLDDAVGDAVMDSQFKVSPPNMVTVELFFSGRQLTASLDSLTARSKK